jgi:hypothetical protein
MDTSRLTTGDIIAGVGGIVLLISLFLPWYGAGPFSVSGMEALGFIDILLLLIAVAVIAIVAGRASARLPAEIPAAVVLLAAGALAVLLVLYRIVNIPGDGDGVSRELGIFLALIGAAAVTYGGWRTNAETPGAPAAPARPPAV